MFPSSRFMSRLGQAASLLACAALLAIAGAFTSSSASRAQAEEAAIDAAIAGDPCEGVGYIVLNKAGKPVKWVLRCRGDWGALAVQPCTIQQSVNAHGGIRQWCGCDGVPESEWCHLVKIIPGAGEGGGKPSFVCAGQCPPAPAGGIQEACVMIEENVVINGRKVIRVYCDCVPQDVVEPVE